MHGVKTHAQGPETHVIGHGAHAARLEVHGGGGGEGLGEGVGVSHHQHQSSPSGLKQTAIIRKKKQRQKRNKYCQDNCWTKTS